MQPDYAITSIACDANGLPWVGVAYIGVLKMNEDEKWIVLPTIDEQQVQNFGRVNLLITENNAVWTWMTVPTTIEKIDNILVEYQGNTVDTFTVDNTISSLAEDKDGNLWIGEWRLTGGYTEAYADLVKYDDENWTTFDCPQFGWGYMRTIRDIAFDESGNIWMFGNFGYLLGSTTGVLLRFNGLEWQLNYLPEDTWISSSALQDDGVIWLGTSEGFMKFNNSQWTAYDIGNDTVIYTDDILNDTHIQIFPRFVYFIVIDDDGTKWLGTENGLVAFNENGLTTANSVEPAMMNEVELFPNPARDFITLKMPGEIQKSRVDILNMQGKIMKSFSLSDDQNRLDVSQFPAGVYLVRIQSEGNQILKKFVKQ